MLAGNTLLRPLINLINRTPIDERRTEATYEVRVTTEPASVVAVRELMVEALEAASYPVSEVEVEERGEDDVELVATLVSIGGEVLSAKDLEKVASLPTRDQARAQLLGLFMSPAQQLAAVIAAPAQDLVRVIAAFADKRKGEAGAAA